MRLREKLKRIKGKLKEAKFSKLAICESPKAKKFELTKTFGVINYFKLKVIDNCLPDTHDYYLIKSNLPLDTARKKLTVNSLNMDASQQKEPFIFTYFEDFLSEKKVVLTPKQELVRQE